MKEEEYEESKGGISSTATNASLRIFYRSTARTKGDPEST